MMELLNKAISLIDKIEKDSGWIEIEETKNLRFFVDEIRDYQNNLNQDESMLVALNQAVNMEKDSYLLSLIQTSIQRYNSFIEKDRKMLSYYTVSLNDEMMKQTYKAYMF